MIRRNTSSNRVGPASQFTTSNDGIKLIGDFEGLERRGGSSRFVPKGADLRKEDRNRIYEYIDPIGLPTIGYGHLLTREELRTGMITINGRHVNYKNGITMEQVYDLKRQDLVRFEVAIRNFVKVPITQSMFDALVSWLFNVGTGRMASSTLGRVLNQGNYNQAANELLKWNRAGGNVLAGLTRRRQAERTMFLSEINLVR
jgi:lysozyme